MSRTTGPISYRGNCALPGCRINCKWRMAALIFFLSYLFWEFYTPFNQLGEPFPLIGLELIFWAAVAVAEALAIAAVFEWKPTTGVRSSR